VFEGIYGLVTICVFELVKKPKEHLELFICLENEKKAILFHDYLFDYFNGDMSKVTALEYFGYNSQNYMKHRNFFFKKTSDVGIYLQIPIYKESIEKMVQKWINILTDFDSKINIENIIVLNDPLNWKKFFEARHSIPDNALTKTKQLGGISTITDTIVPSCFVFVKALSGIECLASKNFFQFKGSFNTIIFSIFILLSKSVKIFIHF
jgi:hypothetical protein